MDSLQRTNTVLGNVDVLVYLLTWSIMKGWQTRSNFRSMTAGKAALTSCPANLPTCKPRAVPSTQGMVVGIQPLHSGEGFAGQALLVVVKNKGSGPQHLPGRSTVSR